MPFKAKPQGGGKPSPRKHFTRKHFTAAIIIAGLLALTAAGCSNGSASTGSGSGDFNPGQVVAIVNGSDITAADLYHAMVDDYGMEVLDRLITETLIMQAGAREGITVTEAEVDARMDEMKEMYGGEDAFQMLLLQNNMQEDSFRWQMRVNLMVEKIMEPQMDLDDDSLLAYFEDNRDSFGSPDEVWSSHVLLDTEEEALDILARLRDGADIGELAKEFSTDPSAQVNEGDLGWQARHQLVPEYFNAAFEAEIGVPTGPVESSYGFHVIVTKEKREGRAASFEDVKDEVRQAIIDDQLQSLVGPWLNELHENAQVNNLLLPTD